MVGVGVMRALEERLGVGVGVGLGLLGDSPWSGCFLFKQAFLDDIFKQLKVESDYLKVELKKKIEITTGISEGMRSWKGD